MKNNRVPIIAGNWKMHLTRVQAKELLEGIRLRLPQSPRAEVVVAPSFISLESVVNHLKSSYIAVAAQDVHQKEEGAFTGACSAQQICDVGVTYVIIGHSERRQYFGDTDLIVQQKIQIAFKHQLIPIVCIGESLAEREANQFKEVIIRQLAKAFEGLEPILVAQSVIAYEPVWAIGTGKTAMPPQVEEVHQLIRSQLVLTFGEDVAQKVRLLYGGSVKASNSRELLALPNVDGALIGGASLKAEEFVAIIQSLF